MELSPGPGCRTLNSQKREVGFGVKDGGRGPFARCLALNRPFEVKRFETIRHCSGG